MRRRADKVLGTRFTAVGQGREMFHQFLVAIKGEDAILGVRSRPRAAVASPEMDFFDARGSNALQWREVRR